MTRLRLRHIDNADDLRGSIPGAHRGLHHSKCTDRLVASSHRPCSRTARRSDPPAASLNAGLSHAEVPIWRARCVDRCSVRCARSARPYRHFGTHHCSRWAALRVAGGDLMARVWDAKRQVNIFIGVGLTASGTGRPPSVHRPCRWSSRRPSWWWSRPKRRRCTRRARDASRSPRSGSGSARRLVYRHRNLEEGIATLVRCGCLPHGRPRIRLLRRAAPTRPTSPAHAAPAAADFSSSDLKRPTSLLKRHEVSYA